MTIKKRLSIFAFAVIISLTLFTATAFAANYTIVKNDSLYTISRLFNTSVNKIMSDNLLTSSYIYTGQVLKVPATVYTVKGGDTLYLISQRYGIPLNSLRKANNEWDHLIYIGQKLLLPGIIPSGETASATANTVIPYTTYEVDLLSRLISAEARGEDYQAMVGVGAVVVNRVQSQEWPNTIYDVIYHVTGGYQQFTPVKNGEINKPATSDAIRAAWAALYGADPSNNAMFYFDDSSTNQWLWSKTITARIDHMVFVK